ncbi:MAG: hypothetical protein HY369_05335 [Candidatus Aenigmarchaeota archaeon]|nr:hypothetical protein [Candidatus Aenigmarchaeota archaeon]
MANTALIIGIVVVMVIVAAVAMYTGILSPAGESYAAAIKKNTTHLECVSNTCTKVSGAGTNKCSPLGSACGNQTHLECISNTCTAVSGPGTNQCSPAGAACGKPDLTIPDVIYFVKDFDGKNATILLSATVKNIGDAQTGTPWTIATFALSAGGSTKLYNGTAFGSLLPGMNTSASVIATIAASTTYIVIVTADSANAIAESNESNNQKSIMFIINNSTLPDLTVTNLIYNATPSNSTSNAALSATVKNIGQAGAWSSGYENMKFLVSPNNLYFTSTPIIPAGGEFTINAYYNLTPGVYNATATVDYQKKVNETNDANNELTVTFVV